MNNKELDKLLPRYANNTLEEEEKNAVEAYLAESESARNKLALLQNMAKQIKEEADLVQTKSNATGAKAKAAMPSWAASLGVAAMLVIALQLTFVFQPTQQDDFDVELLSSLPATITEPHWVIQLAFEPTASWADISKTLTSVNGVIIDGPSSIGLIRAAIPKDNERFTESQAVLGWLNTQLAVAHVALEEE